MSRDGLLDCPVGLLTGASSGIGRALAKELAARGVRLGLVARRTDELESLAAEIRAAGGTAVVAPADVADRAQVEAAVGVVRAALGPIRLAVANAGVGRGTTLDPAGVADIEHTIRVNLLGVVYTFAAVLPDMLAAKSGRLCAVSSLAGYRGFPGQAAYCASKAGVIAYCDSLRVQLRGSEVMVTTVCPGFVRTPMTATHRFQMPQLMEPEYAARRIADGLARGTKVLNFPRRLHLLVKLSRWLPDWAIRRVAGKAIDEPE